jgi:amino acid adenylation domain-containing protein
MLNKENLKDIYPLSPMQAGMLFHALLNSRSDAYFEQTTLVIRGRFDVNLWKKSWQILVQRHDILRTVFSYKKTEHPLQIVLKQSDVEFSLTDLRHLDTTARNDYLVQYKQQDRQRGFDLTQDKLTRVALFQRQQDEYVMVWSFPHILLDGWCNGIIHEELLTIYQQLQQGKTPNLPPAPPYSRYIQWLGKQDKTAAAHYWKTYLENYTQLSSVPKEKFLAPSANSAEVVEYELTFEAEIYQKIQQIAVQHQVTLNTLVQAMWSILLSVYNGVTDVVFGVTVSGRPTAIADIERTLGLFINTIPVRAQVTESLTASELIQQLHQHNLASKNYDFYPLAEIQSLTPLKHNLFDHLLIFENVPQGQDEILDQSLGFRIEQQEMYEHTHYHFVLSVLPGDNLVFKFSYHPRLYLAAQIARIAAHCEHLLNRLLVDSSFLIKDLDILPKAEKNQLLQQFNPTVDVPVTPLGLVALFEAQVIQTPEQIAVRCGSQQLTYRELNAHANRVAFFLRDGYGIQPDDRIALLLDRSIDLVIALWGILKSGAAYVPLDPTYPAPRIQYVLEHSQAKLVLTQANYMNQWENMNAMEFATILSQPHLPTDNLPIITQPQHLAYVIYTSGSTGLPKGVMLMQRNVVSFCTNLSTRFGFTSRDTLYAVTTVTFDISVLELIGTLLLGMQVIVAKEENTRDPRQLVQELKTCSIVQTTPSRLQMIIDSEGLQALAHLRVILVGGEALSQSLFEQLSSLSHTQVFNVYGPTETAIWSTTKLLNGQLLTIGNPLEHESVYILSENLHLLPIGVIGEVCIGGAGVSRGYWRDEQKTQQQFVPNPFRPGEMLYKTGDLGRWLSNGEIEFLGRKDFQVKVRGFRIELGEIEHRLVQLDAVRQAVVVAQEGNLIAYLVVDIPVQPTDLKKYLLEWLPDYMIPTHFITVETLPLTPNGKIDRKALPKLENMTVATSEQIAPRTELEQQLAEIWCSVLGIAHLGVRDNFFELGGHSLKAVQLMTKIRQQCQREVSLTQFFQEPTIEGLVRQWTTLQGLARLNPAQLQPQVSVICVPPILGYGIVFQPLSEHLPDNAWYAIDFVENVPNLLDHYLHLLRALHLTRYVLLGFSAGATVALQLAKLLEQQGECVSDVILLDSQRLAANLSVSETEMEQFLQQGLAGFFTEALGDKTAVKRQMHGYAELVLTTLDTGVIKANIHYIQAVGSDIADWHDVTCGKYSHYQGFGEHFAMLHPPYAAQNAQLIRQILASDGATFHHFQ